jgi:signal transduction histidine kinase
MPRLLQPLLARSTWRGWTYFVLGAALITPYLLVSLIGSSVLSRIGDDSATFRILHFGLWLVMLLVPMVATGLVPAVRVMQATAAKELLGSPEEVGEGRSWPARLRTCGWFTGHILIGAAVGILSIGLPVWIGTMVVAQFRHDFIPVWLHGWHGMALLVAGLVALVGFGYGVALLTRIAARLAPLALGPSPAERIVEVERRADALAERNRLARELHDSVGHALSIVTVQAGAANRVLQTDPGFVRTALGVIEESARAALEDLDHVLGLLREEQSGAKAPQRTLKDLDDLLRKTGMKVDAKLEGDLSRVPAAVSREAYRIVQEGLTNALKHAGDVPVTLRLAVRAEELDVEMINPLGAVNGRGHSGGRGLPGIRERVRVLRGELAAGPQDGRWRVAASIPLKRSGQV